MMICPLNTKMNTNPREQILLSFKNMYNPSKQEYNLEQESLSWE